MAEPEVRPRGVAVRRRAVAVAVAEAALRDSLQSWDQQQNTVNANEAENPNLFVSGWRPAIGWVGAAGLTYQYVVRPFAVGITG